MGRKKKQVETQPVEVKVTKNAAVSYAGGATIKIVKNGKVRRTIQQHNEGTLELFKFITNCLAGNYQDDNRPIILRVGYLNPSNPDESTDYSLAYVISSNSRAYVKEDTHAVIDISFNVPGSLINIGNISTSTPLNCLRIYSDTNKSNWGKYSAQIKLTQTDDEDNEAITSLSKDESLLIVWEMEVSTQINGGE